MTDGRPIDGVPGTWQTASILVEADKEWLDFVLLHRVNCSYFSNICVRN